MRGVHQKQSYAARRADALVLMAESLLANGAASRAGGERNHIVVHVDAEVLADPDTAGRSELEGGPGLAAESARRLACDASVVRLTEDGGGTSLANLVQLCHFHHRLVHEGGYGVRVTESQHFEFTRPDGRVIESVPGHDSAESSGDTDIETLNRANGLDIDTRTRVTLWDGTAMDHAMAVDALLQRDGALHLDPDTGLYPAHFPPARE